MIRREMSADSVAGCSKPQNAGRAGEEARALTGDRGSSSGGLRDPLCARSPRGRGGGAKRQRPMRGCRRRTHRSASRTTGGPVGRLRTPGQERRSVQARRPGSTKPMPSVSTPHCRWRSKSCAAIGRRAGRRDRRAGGGGREAQARSRRLCEDAFRGPDSEDRGPPSNCAGHLLRSAVSEVGSRVRRRASRTPPLPLELTARSGRRRLGKLGAGRKSWAALRILRRGSGRWQTRGHFAKRFFQQHWRSRSAKASPMPVSGNTAEHAFSSRP